MKPSASTAIGTSDILQMTARKVSSSHHLMMRRIRTR
jgi:hypothetical protein